MGNKSIIGMVNACIEANAERRKFEGDDYQVVPAIALKEGVHSGSAGAAYYPGAEISKFAEAWNGVPLPVLHPIDANGNYVSCNTPETIEKQSVGRFFNVHCEDGKLKGELWINIEKAKKISPAVLDILSSGQMLEVSTSFFSDQDMTSGDWNGENYEMVIRNIRPDHLALLPGGQGACSVKDGCGAPRVNAEGGEPMEGKDKSVGKVRALLTQFVKGLGLTVQEVSHEETRDQIQKVLDGYDTKETVDMPISHFVREVYADHFIYEQYDQEGGKLFKLSYTTSGDGTVKLGKKPAEVRQETEYVAVKSNTSKGGESNMEKIKEMATALIANEQSSLVEVDREFLEGLTEEQLTKLEPKVNEVKHPDEKDVAALIALETSPFEDKDKGLLSGLNICQFTELVEKYPPEKKKEEPKVNEEEKPVTVDSYIEKAPAEIQDVLANGVKMQNEQKDVIIKGLLANKRNTFTEDQLKAKKIDELQALAKLAQVDVDYSGNGGSANTVLDNGEPLVAPTMNEYQEGLK